MRQVWFLSELIDFREECCSRLKELAFSENKEVVLWALPALLKSPERDFALPRLLVKAKERIIDSKKDGISFPFAWFLPDIIDDAKVHGDSAINELLKYAQDNNRVHEAQKVLNSLEHLTSNPDDESEG